MIRARTHSARRAALAVAAALAMARSPALAGGPLLVGKDGKPRHWSTASAVRLNPDRGSLGGIGDAIPIIEYAIAQWNGVSTATLKVEIGDRLSTDVEDLTEAQFNALISKDDDTNPVIFDSTGKMFDALFGEQSGVIGVAGPSLIIPSSGIIAKGFAMFNGDGAGSGTLEEYKAVVTHELGHFLGLGHSQINGLHVGGTIQGFSGTVGPEDVETMFPVLIDSPLKPHPMATLHADDVAAYSALYPASGFAGSRGGVTGIVFDVDGDTPLQGVNVIARNVDRPFEDAFSYVSGSLVDPDGSSAPAALRGTYDIRGLTPNATYRLYIEEVGSFFTAGASVGPLDPPLDLDPTRPAGLLEFWNGRNESSENPPDDPSEADDLRVAAGAVAQHVDFVFNGVRPRVAAISPSSGTYLKLNDVSITGSNFIGAVAATLRGPAEVRLPTADAETSSLMKAKVPPGIVPGVYQVFVTNGRGESDPSGVEYVVTEPEPIVLSLNPDLIQNSNSATLTVLGQHLLGARAARLVRQGAADVVLEIADVITAGRIVVAVPAGVVPGKYELRVTNTEGESATGVEVFVVELAPVLSGATDPPAAGNSSTKQVRISGENLAGTTAVELVKGGAAVTVQIVSTSLNDVVVKVPAHLAPGLYTVRLTNSQGTATGPSVFEVRKGGGGGGGGCESGAAGVADGPCLAILLVALAVFRRTRAARAGADRRRAEGVR